MNTSQKTNHSGFFQIIILIVIFVFIALLFGKNPVEIWKEFIEPLVTLGFSLFVKLLNFLVIFISNLMS